MDSDWWNVGGSPYDTYHHPANLFVAEFIGDPRINRLDGKFQQREGALGVELVGYWLPVSGKLQNSDGDVVVTVRPEAILMSREKKEGWIEAQVEVVQPTGADTIIQVRALQAQIRLLQPGFLQFEPNAPIWLNIDKDAVNYFDAGSGKNLRA